MGYIIGHMFWYIVIALVLGLVVGWTTCSKDDNTG